jgi:hypothetical protein
MIDSNTKQIILKNALSPEICQLLADYARLKLSIRPNIHKNKDPLANIHREYGDAMMEVLLERLKPLVEQATGLELWPTLSFYYTYTKGNKLMPHKDRSSCEFVAGLYIGADEHYIEEQGSWSLVMNNAGKAETVDLSIGDLVIFKGHETEHWRDCFTGEWFVSAIFAYVDKNGPFAFQKYDQRKQLGKPHVGMFNWYFGCLKQKIKNRCRKVRS